MKEHYTAKLKREKLEMAERYAKAIQALKEIALEKTLNPQQVAHTALNSCGLIPISFDENLPRDQFIYIGKDLGLQNNKVDDYF